MGLSCICKSWRSLMLHLQHGQGKTAAGQEAKKNAGTRPAFSY